MAKYQFTVEVHPQFLPEQSAPDEDNYVFAYTITITNTGEVPAQLISRSWSVNDSNGLTEKVKGLGVIGQQPFLKPGQAFEYTSGTRLRTPTGTMHGVFFCVAEDGEKFDADVPMFVLDALSGGPSGSSRTLH
ncbi:MAG: Co2+/Mg2+ efflux protein ApaG [Rhodoferax sp.]|nr:Co2+/Mg2+ efflux protein ApaG [Rhodoferax sp.]